MHRFLTITKRSDGAAQQQRAPPPTPPGLPDPQEEATPLAREQFASANVEVQTILTGAKGKKRGKYNEFTEEERLQIAQEAVLVGPTKAARKFSTPDQKLRESTVRSIRDQYRDILKRRRLEDGTTEPIKTFPT
jgi:hypothetical protein